MGSGAMRGQRLPEAARGTTERCDAEFQMPTESGLDRVNTVFGDVVRILVIGEDPGTQQLVADYLGERGIFAVSISARKDMVRQFAHAKPSLVILNLRHGQDNGLGLLREIRSRSDIPVIITAGHRCDEADRVLGLELGADDCMSKPFGLRELLARIRAVLRGRESGRGVPYRDSERGLCRFGDWQLDRRTRRLTDPNGAPIALTKGEYALLLAFLNAPQRPLTREQLLQAIRVHEDICDRSIDVRVLRLRRKLETGPGAPRVIQTARGVGYVFTVPVEPLANGMPDHNGWSMLLGSPVKKATAS
jgi:two-component system, OmpR family, response regulator